ncbi:hypothetical protein MSAN_01817200 [Mycena sanguinolenta]|uniref:Uncharacterized protein n=1 Tax=Mycena sanguinolenta TaxID=230812 RepID=A0A8H6XUG1_9AGAR|nr:hypothetical protein MSAN_01817200 [Mycena sanguinolenta]
MDSRPPRPHSPVSMYVSYEMATTKPPKPLIKLEKQPKGPRKRADTPLPDQPGGIINPASHSTAAPSSAGHTHTPSIATADQQLRASSPFRQLRRKAKSDPQRQVSLGWMERLRRTPVAPIVDVDQLVVRSCHDDFEPALGIDVVNAPGRVSESSATSISSTPSSETIVEEESESHISCDDVYMGPDDAYTQHVSSFLRTVKFRPPSGLKILRAPSGH